MKFKIGNVKTNHLTMKKVILYLFAIVAFAACTQAEIGVEKPAVDNSSLLLNVGFESDADESRVQLDEAGKTVWTKNDLVSVFYRTPIYQQWQFQGNTGDRSGVIAPVGEVDAPSVSGNIVVLYPDNANYTYDIENNAVKATIAAEQHYAENSYGEGGNLMVAQSTSNDIMLKNVYGWLKINLTGDTQLITSIKLTGNKNEQLAGAVTINVADATASFTATDAPTTTLTLTSEDGVPLMTDDATSFYIGLLPTTFEEGITIEIENIEGGKMTKSTSNKVVIERRTIQPMAAFEFVPEQGDEPVVEAKYPYDYSIWYNTSDNAQLTLSTSPTNANVTSHAFGACANGSCYAYYAIDFDSNVTTVNQAAFYNSKLSIIYLPNTVTTIGQAAFLGSTNLETVHIGNSIESIGVGAFSNCSNLQSLYIRSTTPPSLGESALLRDDAVSGSYKYVGALIYVPMSAVETYATHPDWEPYKEYIVGYDFITGESSGGGSGPGASVVSQFNQRLLILEHTDEACSFCPEAMDRMHALANSEYKNYYNEVTLHAGTMNSEGTDPAFSSYAKTLYAFQGIDNLPTIYLNYFGGAIPRGSSDDYFVNTTMRDTFNAYRSKTGAPVGIAIETTAQSGTLNVNVDVKSAKKMEYLIAVWVLENNIYSPTQNNATSELHKTYNHALRYVATPFKKSDISGDELGELEVDEVAEVSYSIPINSSWVTENLEVIVIVSAYDENYDYEVVNTAVCPVNSTKDYEYLSDVESGGGGDDDVLGGGDDDGAIRLTNFKYKSHVSGYYYTYVLSDDNGTSVDLYVHEGVCSNTTINTCQLTYISPASMTCNPGYFHAKNVKVNGESKTVSGGTMIVLNGELSLTLTFSDDTEQKFVCTM